MAKNFGGIEKRQFGRRQTSLHAWISVAGRPRLPCVVKDISVGGALIEFEKPSWLPFNFQLTIEATRFTTWCEVRHQGPNNCGVRFMTAIEAAALDLRGPADGRLVNDKDAWAGTLR
jgi:PilZ domain